VRLRLAEADDPSNRDVTWDVLSEKINDVIILADVSGRIFYASPACRTLGYAQHELIGRAAADLVHPDDLEHMEANVAALFGAALPAGPVDREHRFLRGDGSWVWLEGNPNLIPGPDGRPMGLINVFRDVTERRLARDALREQARRAEMAEDVAGVGYWRLDAKTNAVTWSRQMFLMYGLPAGQEPPLATAMAMTDPEDQDAAMARLQLAITTGVGWSDQVTPIQRPGGETRYLNGRAVCEKDASGQVVAIFGTLVDVTEQKLARRKIEESERRYRMLTEDTTDMISLTASDGRHLYLSPSVARMTGYTIAELMPRRMREFVHPDDLENFIAFYGDVISGLREGGQTIRYRVRHNDGSWIWLESIPRLVRSAIPGQLDEIVDVSRNVTEQQRMKDRLREALAAAEQATQVKSEFLANMSHEIRTPLTAVLGYTSLLAERADLDPLARAQVERIAAAGRGLLAIVNDVLDFSKLEAGQTTITPRPTAAAALAREVLGMFAFAAQAKSLALRFDAAPEAPDFVLLDGDRLRQVLVNLVGNAVKFTDAGTVDVSLSYDTAAGRLAVEVRDTGPGIAARAQEKLFKRFSQVDGSSTRAKGGSGLGLAICQGLAEAMGGSISLRSRVGKGSTFRVELPAATVSRPALDDAAASRGGLEGLRLLVVDDHSVNRELVRAILEPHGVEVSEAHDGREAVEFAADLPVDLILMDLRMPNLDGHAAALVIRTGDGPNRDIPILSFSAEHESSSSGPERGPIFSGRVRKPLQAAELLNALRLALVDEDVPMDEVLRHAGP
jgi:PAS domain S-box-containing protein